MQKCLKPAFFVVASRGQEFTVSLSSFKSSPVWRGRDRRITANKVAATLQQQTCFIPYDTFKIKAPG